MGIIERKVERLFGKLLKNLPEQVLANTKIILEIASIFKSIVLKYVPISKE
jgi:hypothetical protein